MVINSKTIIILNLTDEKLHCISGSDDTVKYRHGNMIVKNAWHMSFV